MDIRSALSWSLAACLLLASAACQRTNDGSVPPVSTTSTASPSASPVPTPSASVTPISTPTVTPSATPTAVPTTAASEEEQLGAPFGTAPTSHAATAPWQEPGMNITGIRIGHHEGYERVVVDLAGRSDVGWMTYWTSDPRTQGAGSEINLPGTITLVVAVLGLQVPPAYDVSWQYQHLSSGIVGEIYLDPVFEGQAQVMIALDKQRPYRIFTLNNPARLVIDIQNT